MQEYAKILRFLKLYLRFNVENQNDN